MPMKRRECSIACPRRTGGRRTSRTPSTRRTSGRCSSRARSSTGPAKQAFAVRMIDAEWRGETIAARSGERPNVRELKAIHDRHQFLPVNLIAADSGGEVLYADPGPIPNLPDDLVERLRGAGRRRATTAPRRPASFAATRTPLGPASSAPRGCRSSTATTTSPIRTTATGCRTRTRRSPATRRPSAAGDAAHAADAIGPRACWRASSTADGRESHSKTSAAGAGEREHGGPADPRRRRGALPRAPTLRIEITVRRGISLRAACGCWRRWDLRANLESRGALPLPTVADGRHANGPGTRVAAGDATCRRALRSGEPVSTPRGFDGVREAVAAAGSRPGRRRARGRRHPLDAPLGDWQGVTRKANASRCTADRSSRASSTRSRSDFRRRRRLPGRRSLELELDPRRRRSRRAGPRSCGILTYSLSVDPESPHHADQTRSSPRSAGSTCPSGRRTSRPRRFGSSTCGAAIAECSRAAGAGLPAGRLIAARTSAGKGRRSGASLPKDLQHAAQGLRRAPEQLVADGERAEIVTPEPQLAHATDRDVERARNRRRRVSSESVDSLSLRTRRTQSLPPASSASISASGTSLRSLIVKAWLWQRIVPTRTQIESIGIGCRFGCGPRILLPSVKAFHSSRVSPPHPSRDRSRGSGSRQSGTPKFSIGSASLRRAARRGGRARGCPGLARHPTGRGSSRRAAPSARSAHACVARRRPTPPDRSCRSSTRSGPRRRGRRARAASG